MSYEVIADFRGGLDARKYKLSLPPGTLTQLLNGHITQGSEIEKRKAFIPVPLPSLTYGAQETGTEIIVFGSRDILGWTIGSTIAVGSGLTATWSFGIDTGGHTPPAVGDPITVAGSSVAAANGNWIVLTWTPGIGTSGAITVAAPNAAGFNFSDTGTIVPHFIAPVTYLQLTHPLPSIQLAGIVSSTYFDGLPLAVTTWNNGDSLVFYGTTLLKDFYVGLGGSIEQTPLAMANDLCDAINATGQYTAKKPTLTKLYLIVTGGAVSGDTFTVNYALNRAVTWPDGDFQNPGFIVLANAVPFHTSLNQTAADIVTAIGNALDIGGGNAGFTAATGTLVNGVFTPGAGSVVQITSNFGLNALDVLTVTTAGNASAFVPAIAASFDVFSIPSSTSPTPFSPAVDVENESLTFSLISNGVAATAGAQSVGQFSIFGGTSNTAATATITQSGQPSVGQTITIGTFTYKFVTVLTGANYEVLLGANAAATLANLANAINTGTGAGVVYGFNTPVNTSASAVLTSATVITLTASTGGTIGNSVALSTTALNYALVAFSGGGPNTNGISQITVAGISLLLSAVQYNASNSQTANDIAAGINANTGTSGFSATCNNNTVSIMSVSNGATYNNVSIVVTSTGNVITANCHFVVLPATGNNISSITVGSGVTNLLTATITFQDSGHTTESIAQFLGRVSANIVANSGTSGYTAWVDANNNAIWIGALVNKSSDTTATISVTSNGIVTGSAVAVLTLTANVASDTVLFLPGQLKSSFSQQLQVAINGGVGPFTVTWSAQGAPSNLTTAGGKSMTINYNYSSPLATAQQSNSLQTILSNISQNLNIGLPIPSDQFGTINFTYQLFCEVVDSTPGTPQSAVIAFGITVLLS